MSQGAARRAGDIPVRMTSAEVERRVREVVAECVRIAPEEDGLRLTTVEAVVRYVAGRTARANERR